MKRVFDLISSGIGLILAAPLIGAVALLIKVTSPGSMFFGQERVGFSERVFRVFKFRTMVDRADAMGTSVTAGNDPRITPIGRILRRTKLDELPQLINVFRGDMSLVGPRPDVPEIVENYSPEMRRIFSIKPGITSVATLHLRDEEGILAKVEDPDKFYEDILVPLKVKLAMEHVDRNSFWFDMKILLQTVWMLTLGRFWPIEVHPEVESLKRQIQEQAHAGAKSLN
ncbi:MAG: sugar transferase [Deltaproteobacteria bacterium]|nr:sugar transferase [Deltaproteobacteria bacterium]